MLNISVEKNEYLFNFFPFVTYLDMQGVGEIGCIISVGWLSWSIDFDFIKAGA